MAVQPGLCGTWSETPKTGFLRTRLKWLYLSMMLPKDADSIANSEDPDLTAPVEAVVCRSALFAQTHLSGLGPEHNKTKKMIQACNDYWSWYLSSLVSLCHALYGYNAKMILSYQADGSRQT